jgi:hypothetical protein
VTDIEAWFEALDRFADVSFIDERPQQPPVPATRGLFV